MLLIPLSILFLQLQLALNVFHSMRFLILETAKSHTGRDPTNKWGVVILAFTANCLTDNALSWCKVKQSFSHNSGRLLLTRSPSVVQTCLSHSVIIAPFISKNTTDAVLSHVIDFLAKSFMPLKNTWLWHHLRARLSTNESFRSQISLETFNWYAVRFVRLA